MYLIMLSLVIYILLLIGIQIVQILFRKSDSVKIYLDALCQVLTVMMILMCILYVLFRGY